VARLALAGGELRLAARRIAGGQDPREVGDARAQHRHGGSGRRAEQEERRQRGREEPRPAASQNFTSGGVSAPARASKVARGSACSRKRAVRFVGKKRTSLLY